MFSSIGGLLSASPAQNSVVLTPLQHPAVPPAVKCEPRQACPRAVESARTSVRRGRALKLRTVAIAITLAAIALLIVPARAMGTDGRRAPRSASPPVATDPGAVPWSSVGTGWLLASWEPHPHAKEPVEYLELVSPLGTRYVLYRLPSGVYRVSDWSGDGQRILLVRSLTSSSVVSTVDLQTGAVEQSFTIRNASSVFATFTRPRGLAVLATDMSRGLVRYSLRGSAQTRFPDQFGRLGKFTYAWLESPDGTEVVLGARHGLAIFENEGTPVAQLPVAHADYCQPVRWWSPTVILATCNQFERYRGIVIRLLRFSTAGTQPEPLARLPVAPDLGDSDAWRVEGSVFLQSTTGCGYGFLSKLRGGVPTPVHVPGLVTYETSVVATTSDSLALLSADGCTGKSVVDWYTPSTGSVLRVLGPPVSGGSVLGILGFPDPTTAVGPNYG